MVALWTRRPGCAAGATWSSPRSRAWWRRASRRRRRSPTAAPAPATSPTRTSRASTRSSAPPSTTSSPSSPSWRSASGPRARWLHLGMTSSDVLDTSLGMIAARRGGPASSPGVDRAMAAVKKRAFEHKRTVMMGRSHGIHAEPITFGHKLAIWYDELRRGRGAPASARATSSRWGRSPARWARSRTCLPSVEEHACRKLGLTPAPASSQIIQRDRHAEFFTALALLGASIEKFAVEIRHLQRTEVREVGGALHRGAEGQLGDAAQAQPHPLARTSPGWRGCCAATRCRAMEDVPLWHERDISHSSVERVIGPDATVVAGLHAPPLRGADGEPARLPGADAEEPGRCSAGVVNSPAHPARARAQGHGPAGRLRHRPAQRDEDVRGGRRLPGRAARGRGAARR